MCSTKSARLASVILLASCFCLSCDPAATEDIAETTEEQTDAKAGKLLIDAFDALPKITDPVTLYEADATGIDVEKANAFNSLQIDTQLINASTGIPLGSAVSDLKQRLEANENASSSLCRTMNQVFRFMASAVEPDLISCYIQAAFGDRAEFYDGNYNIYDFSIVEEEYGEQETFDLRAKVKVEVGDDDKIELFEAFICEAEEQGAELKFIEYLKKTIADAKIKIYEKRVSIFDNNGDDQEIFIETEVNSSIDSDGKMVGLKTIIHAEISDDNRHMEKSIVTQSAENIRYIGWSGSGDRLRKYYSFTELLDSNVEGEDYSPRKLAYGDGAAILDFNGSITTEGWDGDTLSIDPNSSRLVKVEGKESELPSDTTPPTLSWSDEQKYDCSGDPVAKIELGLEASRACNERYWMDQETSDLCQRWGY